MYVRFIQAGAFLLAATGLCAVAQAQTVDIDAAEDLARKSNCTKCHAVLKTRLGPAFKTTADKYRDRADAAAVLTTHITTGPKIMVDDEEETHQSVKTTDAAAIQNLVRYILSR
jgi:cytochrome c